MSLDPEKYQSLLKSIREGSDEAAQELVNEYGSYIERTIRKRLSQSVRSKFDTTDFSQAVWMSFFAHFSVVTRIETPEALIAFLSQMARNKVIDESRRRLMTKKNNVNKEKPFEDENATAFQQPSSKDPTPSENLIAHELWEELIENLSPRDKQILELRIQGKTQLEIAEEVNLERRTVIRVLHRIYQKLNQP